MKSNLKIGGYSIMYDLVKGKRHQVRISFTPENLLRIESGSGKLGPFEKKFIEKNEKWILRSFQNNQVEAVKRQKFFKDLREEVSLLGIARKLRFVISRDTRYHYTGDGEFIVFAPANMISEYRIELLRFAILAFASNYIEKRTNKWAKEMNLFPKKISIKSHRSKWGSCSSLGNINLNWYLILLDKWLVDYIIVHELAHLKELNHGPKFWRLVEAYMPDHKTARKQLNDLQWVIGILD